jgi:hypothetical protein
LSDHQRHLIYMKMKYLFILSFTLAGNLCFSQVNPTTLHLVYQEPGMDKVMIQKGVVYKTHKDTTLVFDVYYPPGFNSNANFPVPIFRLLYLITVSVVANCLNGQGTRTGPGLLPSTAWLALTTKVAGARH